MQTYGQRCCACSCTLRCCSAAARAAAQLRSACSFCTVARNSDLVILPSPLTSIAAANRLKSSSPSLMPWSSSRVCSSCSNKRVPRSLAPTPSLAGARVCDRCFLGLLDGSAGSDTTGAGAGGALGLLSSPHCALAPPSSSAADNADSYAPTINASTAATATVAAAAAAEAPGMARAAEARERGG